MTRFRYRAVDPGGQSHKGTLEALDPGTARRMLRDQGLLPISVSQSGRDWAQTLRKDTGSRRISSADLTVFTRQLATLISSGVQIEMALAAIAKQANPRLAALCRVIRKAVLDGSSFATALKQESSRFDRFYLTSVQAGESAGRMGQVLNHLADHIEDQHRNKQTILLALIYPIILICVSIAVVVALLIFVLPDIVRVFAARGADLPPLTKLMIGLSDALSQHGLLLSSLVGIIWIAAMFGLRHPASKHFGHRVLWRSGLARQATVVQFSGTLATLTQSGVTLADALPAACATVGNLQARSLLQEAGRDVRDGLALSAALSRQKDFPPMMITMIASGEASGTLPGTLDRFARDQSHALQSKVKALLGLVEPIVLLIMGGVVMLLVLAILMPIVNLNSLVG